MRTETKTIKIFKFEELSDKAKEKARDWFKQARDSSDLDHVVTMFQEVAEALGITFATRSVKLMSGATRQDPKIFWSLGYVQGDGANFEGTWRMADVKLDKIRAEWTDPSTLEEPSNANTGIYALMASLEAIVESLKKANVAEARIDFHAPHNYFTLRLNDAELLDAEGQNIDILTEETVKDSEAIREVFATFERDMKEFGRDLCTFLYDQIRAEDEYQTADEHVDDSIIANEYEFLENGERYI
jgi:hypothetical protein